MFSNFISIIGVLCAALACVIPWKEYMKKRESDAIGNQISAEDYLKNCYDNNENSNWCKDDLAQKLTRIIGMNHTLNNRLIELHENDLIDYHRFLNYYRNGSTQIRFIKSDHVSFIRDIQFSPILKSTYKLEKFVLGVMFLLGLVLLLIPIYEVSRISLQNKELNFIELFNVTCIFLEGIIIICVALYFKRIIENAYLFVTLLHEAEVKFLKIKSPKKVKKPS